jgi:hypothetical protein
VKWRKEERKKSEERRRRGGVDTAVLTERWGCHTIVVVVMFSKNCEYK